MWSMKPPLGTQLDWGNPLNKGLVMHLGMLEGHGDVVRDLSMYGNHGKLENFAFPATVDSGWNPGLKGAALEFDGAGDRIDIEDALSLRLTEDLTLAARLCVKDYTIKSPILYKELHYEFYAEVYSRPTGNRFIFWHGDGTQENVLDVANKLKGENTWQDIVITRSHADKRVNLYVDGINVATSNYTRNPSPCTHDVTVGAFDGNHGSFLLDEVRILNRAYTAAEVLERYINPYGVYLDEDD